MREQAIEEDVMTAQNRRPIAAGVALVGTSPVSAATANGAAVGEAARALSPV